MSINFSSILPLLLSGSSSSSASSSSSSLSSDNVLASLFGGGGSLSGGSDLSSILGGSFGSSLSGLGGSDFSSVLSLFQLIQGNDDDDDSTTSTTSSSTSSSSSATSAKKTSIPAGSVSLVDDYARSIDQNGNVNNATITARFRNLGLSDEQANDLARVNIIEQYAKEFVVGSRVGTDRDSQDKLAATTLDFSKPGDTFAAVASAFKNDGGNYNNAKLKTLLNNTGNQDLADDGGVGTNDVQTLAAVRTALNRGTLKLSQVYTGSGDKTYVDDPGKYDRAIKYVTKGGLQADIQDMENGVKKKDLNTLNKVSDGISTQKVADIRTADVEETDDTEDSGSAGSAGSSTSSSSSSSSSSTVADSVSSSLSSLRDKLMDMLPMILMMQLFQQLFPQQPAAPSYPAYNPYMGMGGGSYLGSTSPLGSSGFLI